MELTFGSRGQIRSVTCSISIVTAGPSLGLLGSALFLPLQLRKAKQTATQMLMTGCHYFTGSFTQQTNTQIISWRFFSFIKKRNWNNRESIQKLNLKSRWKQRIHIWFSRADSFSATCVISIMASGPSLGLSGSALHLRKAKQTATEMLMRGTAISAMSLILSFNCCALIKKNYKYPKKKKKHKFTIMGKKLSYLPMIR